jgi:hypothetical protein
MGASYNILARAAKKFDAAFSMHSPAIVTAAREKHTFGTCHTIMPQPPVTEKEEPDIKELPQKAIRKIRAICLGNGVEKKEVKIKSAKGSMVTCEALTHVALEPGIEEKTKKGRHQVGELIQDPSHLHNILAEMTNNATKNDEARKYLTNLLLEREDKGFGLQGALIDIEPLQKTYCMHEACQGCHGHGNVTCPQCRGQRQEVCERCHARGMVPCDHCHSTGFITGQNGQRRQCDRCFGKQQINCPLCQRTGHTTCRKCRGSGTNTCSRCQGAAFMTRVIELAVKMKTAFEINREGVHPQAIGLIESKGASLATGEHIKITQTPIKKDDGGLAIEYQVTFPFGEMTFAVGDQDYRTHLFGYKAKMLKLPDFLDRLVREPMDTLEQAARTPAGAAANIEQAGKTRFIADALGLSSRLPAKKAMIGLKKKYPLGSSKNLIQEAVVLSKKAMANATRNARWIGYGVSGGLLAALMAAYFIGPLRQGLFAALPANNLLGLLDFLLIPLGGIACLWLTTMIAKRPQQKILSAAGIDAPPATKSRLRIPVWPSYAISGGVFCVMALLAVLAFGKTIFWLPL